MNSEVDFEASETIEQDILSHLKSIENLGDILK